MNPRPVLSEITLSCVDLVETERWFREGLRLVPAGGKRLARGDPIPGANAVCWWMIAGNARLRLALIQSSDPLPRLLPADFRPCDIGYTRIGVHVPDFDASLRELERCGSAPIGPVVGESGDRRACVRNPDGVYIEIMERDPLPLVVPSEATRAVQVRSITLSTADLDTSVRQFSATTGSPAPDLHLHDDEHESAWGLAGAQCRRALLRSGDVLIELAEYADPRARPRSADHRDPDQGILGIRFDAPVDGRFDRGFTARPAWRRPRPARHGVHSSVTIDAPYESVWAALNDHARMGRWIQADAFRVVRHGSPDSAGYGAERLLSTQGREVLQQVTRVIPGRIGYRAIAGTPFSFHNGTIDVRAGTRGTQLDWTIRFETRERALGALVHAQLQPGIEQMLQVFKRMVEEEG